MAIWIHHKGNNRSTEHWSCSACESDLTENPRFVNLVSGRILDFKHCPFCDAKMKLLDGRVVVEEGEAE